MSSVRIIARLMMTAPNEAALMRKQAGVPTTATRVPPITEPRTRAMFKEIELRMTALARVSRPTRSAISDWRAGL
jgi:hypothetical protein